MAKVKTDKLSAKELKALVKAELEQMNTVAETGKKVTNKDAEFAVKAVAGALLQALKDGKHAGIHGLGTIELRERGSRKGRNPQTGDEIEIPARTGVGFAPSGSLRDAVK